MLTTWIIDDLDSQDRFRSIWKENDGEFSKSSAELLAAIGFFSHRHLLSEYPRAEHASRSQEP